MQPLRRAWIAWARFATACRYLTRLPCPGAGCAFRPKRLAESLPLFPWVGVLIGSIAAAALFFAYAATNSAPIAALAAISTQLYVTGALHEDGFADSVDALGAAFEREKILQILKDPHLGSYAATALWALLTAQWLFVAEIIACRGPQLACWLLIGEHALARFAPLTIMQLLPYLRSHGPTPGKAYPWCSVRLKAHAWLIAAAALAPLAALPLAVACAAAAGSALGALYWYDQARRKLAGYTGDLLGAAASSSWTLGMGGALIACAYI